MHIVRGVAWQGYASLFDSMFILAVATARANVLPPIVLNELYQIAHLHEPLPRHLPQQLLHIQVADQAVQIIRMQAEYTGCVGILALGLLKGI